MNSPRPPYGGPPGYAQYPPQAPNTTAPPKKNTALKVAALIAAVVVVVCAAGGTSLALLKNKLKKTQQIVTSNSPVTNSAPAARPNSGTTWTVVGKFGQATDGHEFQFTVSKVKCGVAKVGSEYTRLGVAHGQYCLVTLTVKNISGTSALFWTDFASANGPDDVAHQPDSSATFWANNNHLPFFHYLHPGESQTGILVFDLAKNAPWKNIKLPDGRAGTVSIAAG